MTLLNTLLNKIKGNRFLVIGRAGMDLYPDPPGTQTEHAEHFYSCLGGSSANIAVALSKHGSHAALLSSVSNDAIGRFCLNELQKYGVDTQHLSIVDGEYRSSLAIVESRIEDHQSVIYRNGAADFQMTGAHINAVDFSQYSAVVTTGTVLAAQPSRSAAFEAFAKAKSLELPLIFDIDYRPYSWPSAADAAQTYSKAAEFSDIIIGNDEEFDFMAGESGAGLAKARDLARDKNKIIVYKKGSLGAQTFMPMDTFTTGIFAVNALKPTGAGDAFMGGFLASLSQNKSIEEAVIRGSASAAIVVSKVGCAPAMPDTAKLDAFISEFPNPPRALHST